MKKALSLALASVLLGAGCSLVSPYTLTFTNTPGSVVDPSTSTLDLVVSAPTLAYVSKVSCEGADVIELLPIVAEGETTSTLHKLALTSMKDMPQGAACEVTVTVFDPTTTETASSSIALTMNGPKVEDVTSEETPAATDEAILLPAEETPAAEAPATEEVPSPVETPTETNETLPAETPADTGTDQPAA